MYRSVPGPLALLAGLLILLALPGCALPPDLEPGVVYANPDG